MLTLSDKLWKMAEAATDQETMWALSDMARSAVVLEEKAVEDRLAAMELSDTLEKLEDCHLEIAELKEDIETLKEDIETLKEGQDG